MNPRTQLRARRKRQRSQARYEWRHYVAFFHEMDIHIKAIEDCIQDITALMRATEAEA